MREQDDRPSSWLIPEPYPQAERSRSPLQTQDHQTPCSPPNEFDFGDEEIKKVDFPVDFSSTTPAGQIPRDPLYPSRLTEVMKASPLKLGSATPKEFFAGRLPHSKLHNSSRLDSEDIKMEDPVPSGSKIDRRKFLSQSNVEDSDSEEEYEHIHLGLTLKDEFRVSPFLCS